MVKYDTYAYVASQDGEVIMHQNRCEKESHQPNLSARVQNEKMKDSTICEEESHKILCERDTQKLWEKEDESCEELFTTNTIIPSSSLVPCVMHADEDKDVVNYDKHPIFDKEDQVMAMVNDTMHDVSMLTHLEDGCKFLDPLVDSSRPNRSTMDVKIQRFK
jgi:hypothetical protein